MSPPLWDPGWIHIRHHFSPFVLVIIHYLSTIIRKLVRDGNEEATWFCTWRHWWKSWRLDSSSLVKRLQSQEFLYSMSPAPAINLTNQCGHPPQQLSHLLQTQDPLRFFLQPTFLLLRYPFAIVGFLSLAIPAWTMQLIYQFNIILFCSLLIYYVYRNWNKNFHFAWP